MLFRFPKNDKQFVWTDHAKRKMLQYRLSDQKIKIILNNPVRTERGIAPKTVAKMKRNDTAKRKEELWVMYQEQVKSEKSKVQKLKIISTWRYPGVSPKREVPIPQDILDELEKDAD
ncbi:MAG: hypothetical protein Q8R26_00915 [bacterium]|nr:hypothetical protein [bacterium]